MSAALWAAVAPDEGIATTNVSINFVAAAVEGEVVCRSTVDSRSGRMAWLHSEVVQDDRLVITAIGTFTILPRAAFPASSTPASDG
jgi:acyl-coenzyme A thioesterase PaaI-like protein